MDVVVVFPCVPATAKQKVSLVMSPKTSARFITKNPLFVKNFNSEWSDETAGV